MHYQGKLIMWLNQRKHPIIITVNSIFSNLGLSVHMVRYRVAICLYTWYVNNLAHTQIYKLQKFGLPWYYYYSSLMYLNVSAQFIVSVSQWSWANQCAFECFTIIYIKLCWLSTPHTTNSIHIHVRSYQWIATGKWYSIMLLHKATQLSPGLTFFEKYYFVDRHKHTNELQFSETHLRKWGTRSF